jgi:hypothetical protein
MWEATASDIPDGRKYRILEDGAQLSFRQVFELLRSSDEFADWYSDTLARYEAVAFLRKGSKDQVRALWRVTADTMLDQISDTPIWLSTAGLGVIWLHLRLDSRPKYYSYRTYAGMG